MKSLKERIAYRAKQREEYTAEQKAYDLARAAVEPGVAEDNERAKREKAEADALAKANSDKK